GVKLSFVGDIEAGRRKLTDKKADLLFGILGNISLERRNARDALALEGFQSELERMHLSAPNSMTKFGLDKSPEQALREENLLLKRSVSISELLRPQTIEHFTDLNESSTTIKTRELFRLHDLNEVQEKLVEAQQDQLRIYKALVGLLLQSADASDARVAQLE